MNVVFSCHFTFLLPLLFCGFSCSYLQEGAIDSRRWRDVFGGSSTAETTAMMQTSSLAHPSHDCSPSEARQRQ